MTLTALARRHGGGTAADFVTMSAQAEELASAADLARFRVLNDEYLAAVRAQGKRHTPGDSHAPCMAMMSCKAWHLAVITGAPQLLAHALNRGSRVESGVSFKQSGSLTVDALATAPAGTLASLRTLPPRLSDCIKPRGEGQFELRGQKKQRVDDVALVQLLRMCRRIRALELFDCHISTPLLAALGYGGCPELEALRLNECLLQDESALEPVLRGCKQLRVLKMKGHVVRDTTIPNMLGKWCGEDDSALRHVDLGYCLEYVTKGVVTRLQGMMVRNKCQVVARKISKGDYMRGIEMHEAKVKPGWSCTHQGLAFYYVSHQMGHEALSWMTPGVLGV